tara:strand:- start:510 stop:1100 length:591 start_codon:yes stop_codon:yes gene_type:complete
MDGFDEKDELEERLETRGRGNDAERESMSTKDWEAESQRLSAQKTSGSKIEEPDVWDEYSMRILEELQAIGSGKKKTAAEQQTRQLAGQLATGGFALAKSRSGVMPGTQFSQAAEQAGLIQGAGEQRAAEINRAARLAAQQDALRFQASKAAEARGLSLGYQSLLQQQQQAEAQATQALFGSFLQFGSNILMAMMV